MLSLATIQQLAQQHALDLRVRYEATTTHDLTAPKPHSLTLWFREECVEAWVALMTQLTEVPVSLYGTRQVTGSGATDGRLHPGYAARLAEVNLVRDSLGLARVMN